MLDFLNSNVYDAIPSIVTIGYSFYCYTKNDKDSKWKGRTIHNYGILLNNFFVCGALYWMSASFNLF